jgi:hypothetical protein
VTLTRQHGEVIVRLGQLCLRALLNVWDARIRLPSHPGSARLMGISPSSYHMVPRTLAGRSASSSFAGPADEHDIKPDGPIACLMTVIPGPALRALIGAVNGRCPSCLFTVADVLVLYRAGELAELPGPERRGYPGIQNGLFIAGLITRSDRPAMLLPAIKSCGEPMTAQQTTAARPSIREVGLTPLLADLTPLSGPAVTA